MTAAKPSIAIVGCGVVGTALGKLLARAGYPILGVAARTRDHAAQGASALGAKVYSEKPWEVTREARIVFITTPDDAIQPTCRLLAERGAIGKGSVVIHCSGALSSEVLSSARACGAFVLSLHPLQSFASVEQAEKLVSGAFFAVEGDKEARPLAQRLVDDLGGILVEITTEGKTLYHAAAVVASNYLVALMHAAASLNQAAGLDQDRSMEVLLPLVRGTLSNIASRGIPAALTGPIARGDRGTVSAHLKAVAGQVCEVLPIYRELGRYTVGLARKKGTLARDAADKLKALFDQAQ